MLVAYGQGKLESLQLPGTYLQVKRQLQGRLQGTVLSQDARLDDRDLVNLRGRKRILRDRRFRG